MTGEEAILAVKKKLNRLDTSSNRTIRPEMCLFYLNDAITKVVKDRYRENVKGDTKAFQRTQQTTDELNPFTSRVDIIPIYNMVSESWEVGFPVNYYDSLYVHAKTKDSFGEYTVNKINIQTLDTLGYALDDPFNEPVVNDPIAYYAENRLIFPTKGLFTLTKVTLIYLHLPEEITLSTDITYSLIKEAIDVAAVMILESWQSQRVQSKMVIDKTEI